MTEIKPFSPEEANQTLPLVRQIVEDILAAGKTMREISQKVGAGAESDPEIVKLMARLEELFDELERIGCSYKDWNFTVGLVDFPGIVEGREVMLCWRSDEDAVKYYHELDEGFAGRKPISGN